MSEYNNRLIDVNRGKNIVSKNTYWRGIRTDRHIERQKWRKNAN